MQVKTDGFTGSLRATPVKRNVGGQPGFESKTDQDVGAPQLSTAFAAAERQSLTGLGCRYRPLGSFRVSSSVPDLRPV